MEETKCTNCNIDFKYLPSQSRGKFCTNKCRGDYERNVVTKEKFYNGLITERVTLRRILSMERGYFCSVCFITEWNNKKIVLQVDHINGDAGNNNPDNLRLICPNCHSQTDSFGGRNKGNGRKARGLSTS